MDGEILVSLKEKHTPTAAHMADLRRELPRAFPQLQFFFQPADIVNQVLNFGQPAPIDIRVTGPNATKTTPWPAKLVRDLKRVPGVVDAHVFQVPDAPALKDRCRSDVAQQMGMTQDEIAQSLLVTLNSSAQIAPNFWLDPRNSVSYPLVVQNADSISVNSVPALMSLPLANARRSTRATADEHGAISRGSACRWCIRRSISARCSMFTPMCRAAIWRASPIAIDRVAQGRRAG